MFRTKPPIPENIKHDCRLVKRKGEYFLQVPIDVETEEPKPVTKHFCSIDPGVRTFATVWSVDGTVEYGVRTETEAGIAEKMMARLIRMDKLRSSIDTETHKRKKRRKKEKVRSVIQTVSEHTKDMHYKIANDSCSRFDNIILPAFHSKPMVAKKRSVVDDQNSPTIVCVGTCQVSRAFVPHGSSTRGKRVSSNRRVYIQNV